MPRSKSFREDEALESALRAFSEAGYAGTSLQDLMGATGLGKGSLYGTFGDKASLFSRSFDAYCTRVVGALERRLEGPDDGALDRLHRALAKIAENHDGAAVSAACFLAKTTAELAARDPGIAGRARDALEAMGALFADCIRQAQRAGAIDPGHDAEALAHLVLTVHRGMEAAGEAGVDPAVLTDSIALTMLALKAPAPVT